MHGRGRPRNREEADVNEGAERGSRCAGVGWEGGRKNTVRRLLYRGRVKEARGGEELRHRGRGGLTLIPAIAAAAAAGVPRRGEDDVRGHLGAEVGGVLLVLRFVVREVEHLAVVSGEAQHGAMMRAPLRLLRPDEADPAVQLLWSEAQGTFAAHSDEGVGEVAGGAEGEDGVALPRRKDAVGEVEASTTFFERPEVVPDELGHMRTAPSAHRSPTLLAEAAVGDERRLVPTAALEAPPFVPRAEGALRKRRRAAAVDGVRREAEVPGSPEGVEGPKARRRVRVEGRSRAARLLQGCSSRLLEREVPGVARRRRDGEVSRRVAEPGLQRVADEARRGPATAEVTPLVPERTVAATGGAAPVEVRLSVIVPPLARRCWLSVDTGAIGEARPGVALGTGLGRDADPAESTIEDLLGLGEVDQALAPELREALRRVEALELDRDRRSAREAGRRSVRRPHTP